MDPRSRAFPVPLVGLLLVLSAATAWAHDIPNQRVDRSIQVTLTPGRIEVDYEVSLTELTLTQDLRRLAGTLPGADRLEWLDHYGRITGPLNAKGILAHCEGLPVTFQVANFDLVVEEHPRYTFHFKSELPERGQLVLQDTNYISSEGTSRLAIRGIDGVRIDGDDLPPNVDEIPIRPVWQLDDEEERRTRRVEVDFRSTTSRSLPTPPSVDRAEPFKIAPSEITPKEPASGLIQLLDRRTGISWFGLLLMAGALGAMHSIQPGHGKTLVSAVALDVGSRWYQPVVLAIVTTLAHTASVLAIAGALWITGATQVAGLHTGLTRCAGFVMAASGFWRIGRTLGGQANHQDVQASSPSPSLGGLLSLGLAGGLVPCWEAVLLVILSAALGRLTTGVLLVLAFGAGMGAVLVAVGLLTSRLKSRLTRGKASTSWQGRLGLVSGLLLACMGMYFFLP